MAELTGKQKAFADEYIRTGNAEQSAIKAGYNARGNTTKLMKNTTITTYITRRAEAQRIAEDKAIAKSVDSGVIADMIEIKRFWRDMMYNQDVKPTDRIKASELIAKTHGAFIERTETTTIDLTKSLTAEQRKARLAELMNKR